MYEGFYHLKENPFRLTPDPAFMCMTGQHQEALSGLIYTVCTRPGLTVLAGEAGTGKTTLLHALMDFLQKRSFLTAICSNPTLTRGEFYDELMLKFGVECTSTLKSRQLAALEEKLRRNRPALLVIDEAQRLSVELLEEIRLLLNLETASEKLVEIILAGQPELLETLGRHDMRQLKQRVSCICRLKPLTREELREYVFHRLAQAGLPNQAVFPDECLDLVYEYTQGIPRLANTLCGACLQVGFALRSLRITPGIVQEAAKDLDLVRPGVRPDALPAAPAPQLMDRVPLKAAAEAAVSQSPALAAAFTNGRNGAGGHADNTPQRTPVQQEARVPLAGYAERQKSLGFFASLIEHWR